MSRSIEKMYILDGGIAMVEDGSIYSPGINVGVPMTLSCNAYLIRHLGQWLLWDTGTQDALVSEPSGRIIAHGIRGRVVRTLAAQLGEIGVDPDDIGLLAISHAHFDHVGNCALFGKARWIAQKAEHDAMFGADPGEFGYAPELYSMLRRNDVRIVEGDHDVFGDGAVRLISTPGHTPGHCSLFVRLPATGSVILSGDVAHNRENFSHRRVPAFNCDQQASVDSMNKVDALLGKEGAMLWINHDTKQSRGLPHSPTAIL